MQDLYNSVTNAIQDKIWITLVWTKNLVNFYSISEFLFHITKEMLNFRIWQDSMQLFKKTFHFTSSLFFNVKTVYCLHLVLMINLKVHIRQIKNKHLSLFQSVIQKHGVAQCRYLCHNFVYTMLPCRIADSVSTLQRINLPAGYLH